MSALTLRNVDDGVKAALKAQAAREGLSQNEAALRALARGLGVPLRRRRLEGLGAALFGPDADAEIARLSEDAGPAYTEAELDAFDAEGLRDDAGGPDAGWR